MNVTKVEIKVKMVHDVSLNIRAMDNQHLSIFGKKKTEVQRLRNY